MIDGNTGDLEGEQSVSTSSKPPNISSVPQVPPPTHVPLPPSPTSSSSSDPSSPTMSESSSESTQPKAKVPTRANPSRASRPTQYKVCETHPRQPTLTPESMPGFASDGEVEYALAVDTSVAEGLDPLSLAEAKRHLDWESWQKAI